MYNINVNKGVQNKMRNKISKPTGDEILQIRCEIKNLLEWGQITNKQLIGILNKQYNMNESEAAFSRILANGNLPYWKYLRIKKILLKYKLGGKIMESKVIKESCENLKDFCDINGFSNLQRSLFFLGVMCRFSGLDIAEVLEKNSSIQKLQSGWKIEDVLCKIMEELKRKNLFQKCELYFKETSYLIEARGKECEEHTFFLISGFSMAKRDLLVDGEPVSYNKYKNMLLKEELEDESLY